MRLLGALLIAASLAGCARDIPPDTPPDELALSRFESRLSAGAQCQELFGFRNALPPTSDILLVMNARLREVGCFSSTSERGTPSSRPETPPSGPGGSFTVREYQVYRKVVDDPRDIPESALLEAVGAEYGMPSDQVRNISDRVQRVLYENGWLGTPRTEIAHASDWSR
jgi:hypothetical protein